MSEELNPYQAPAAPVADAVHVETELADRVSRFLAALLDGVIAMCYMVPLMWALGIFAYFTRRPPQPAPLPLVYTSVAIGFTMFVLINGYWLKKYGQTVGKRVIGIRIVDLDGKVPPFGRLILLRYAVIRLLASIPFVGSLFGLVDVLFIFRDDRRCVHDLLCGTRVIKA